MKDDSTLGSSARESIIWTGGSTLLRDVVQFLSMLVLVRLLSPADYGSAALAQSIIGLVSVVSFSTFVLHALQVRKPSEIDWQLHFTAGSIINSFLFVVTLLVSFILYNMDDYRDAAWPLAALSLVLLVEIPSTMNSRRLETRHQWKRFRTLVVVGTLLGSAVGVIVALAGGGVWALVVQVPLFSLPAAIDLLFVQRWRPDWSWNFVQYLDIAKFGFNRMGALTVARGRVTLEQSLLVSTYDMSSLGFFNRAIGLATLFAGRIGAVSMMALYPVVTRAEQGSARFIRIAGLALRGVVWVTTPAALILALCAEEAVSIVYGSTWQPVVSFLPLAVAGIALAGIASTTSSLLLANNEIRWCLAIDLLSAVIVVVFAFWLIPYGIEIYLAALAIHGLFILLISLSIALKTRTLNIISVYRAFMPACISGAGAVFFVVLLREIEVGWQHNDVFRFATEFLVFFLAYCGCLRLVFSSTLSELLSVVPGGRYLTPMLLLQRTDT